MLPWMVAFARAADLYGDPSTYNVQLAALKPGDVLHLEAGSYTDLYVGGLNGADDAWITITGPESGEPAIIESNANGCCNTVEIVGSSYVAIQHLVIDGAKSSGAFGVSAKQGAVHHIRIEHNEIRNYGSGQQQVAISTKVPTWGWEIRGNTIVEAGTGAYLGNSDGSDPFVGGIIEDNLFLDPIGYCMEIKFQRPRADVPDMPKTPQRTIIRRNTFIKDDRVSPDGDRPNLLVGGFPDSGSGSEDVYEIYGNLFFHNPRESLFQGSGRITIHDNVFIDVAGTAVALRDHDLPLRLARAYGNTIYAAGSGIVVSDAADQGSAVVGNLVFADDPISGTIDDERDNLTDTIANAPAYVSAASTLLGSVDLYPLPGAVSGTVIDLSAFVDDTDYDLDFNCLPKGELVFRGAYAGEGKNPGAPLGEMAPTCAPSTGDTGGETGDDTGAGGGTDTAKNADDTGDSACCRDSGADEGSDTVEHVDDGPTSCGGCADVGRARGWALAWIVGVVLARSRRPAQRG